MALRLNWWVVGLMIRSVKVFCPSVLKALHTDAWKLRRLGGLHDAGRKPQSGEIEARRDRLAIDMAVVQAVAHVEQKCRARDVVVIHRQAVGRGKCRTVAAGRARWIPEAVERQVGLVRP